MPQTDGTRPRIHGGKTEQACRDLCAQHGLTLDVETFHAGDGDPWLWVYAPEGFVWGDPGNGTCGTDNAQTWTELLGRIRNHLPLAPDPEGSR